MPTILRRSTVYSTRWFEIVEKQVSGEELPYYSLKPCLYVTVLAITEDGRIPLVSQFRPAIETTTLELPSGGVEENETPLSAAIRELQEETGLSSSEFEWLGTLVPDTGRLDTRLWCYLAKNAKSNGQPQEKGLELSFCKVRELKEMIVSGRMSNALDLAVINLALMKQKLTL